MNSIATESKIGKIRPNLWQSADGAVIGFGAILAPNGLYFCFTCNGPECEHTQAVDAEWLAGGRDSAKSDAIPTAWWAVNGGADAMSIDRNTGEVSYPEVTL